MVKEDLCEHERSLYLDLHCYPNLSEHIYGHMFLLAFQIVAPKRRRSSHITRKKLLTPKVVSPRYRLRTSTKVGYIPHFYSDDYIVHPLI